MIIYSEISVVIGGDLEVVAGASNPVQREAGGQINLPKEILKYELRFKS